MKKKWELLSFRSNDEDLVAGHVEKVEQLIQVKQWIFRCVCISWFQAVGKGSPTISSFDKLGILSQPAWPPPPPPWRLGHPQQKKFFWCFFCILGYSKHFIFSWKFSFFLVGIGWDWGILGSNNLMNWWDINPPFMYCVFHHISDHLQRLILFWQFYKKVGLRSDPPPLVGPKDQVCQRIYFWGSP